MILILLLACNKSAFKSYEGLINKTFIIFKPILFSDKLCSEYTPCKACLKLTV